LFQKGFFDSSERTEWGGNFPWNTFKPIRPQMDLAGCSWALLEPPARSHRSKERIAGKV